jgi:hypothetical protein
MSVVPRFVWFYRVFKCFAAMGVKGISKVFTKKSKSFYKKIGFCLSLITFLGRFSVRGVQKPVLFWPLTHPPTAGDHRICFDGPSWIVD